MLCSCFVLFLLSFATAGLTACCSSNGVCRCAAFRLAVQMRGVTSSQQPHDNLAVPWSVSLRTAVRFVVWCRSETYHGTPADKTRRNLVTQLGYAVRTAIPQRRQLLVPWSRTAMQRRRLLGFAVRNKPRTAQPVDITRRKLLCRCLRREERRCQVTSRPPQPQLHNCRV